VAWLDFTERTKVALTFYTGSLRTFHATEIDMSLTDKVHQDMVATMKAKDPDRLSTLRMMKTALKNKEIDKRAPLTDAEAGQILVTMVKQRRDSIEQFTKGNRPELAAKEAAEIPIIESYMPKAAGEVEVRAMVDQVIAEMSADGSRPSAKEMGSVMKAVQAKIQAAGLRAEGKQVSEMIKAALAT
jgi:uncharacterized protein YqeY